MERPLPADDHTHSEWSWDADDGSMAGSCQRAVELGLPSIAFTEHLDVTRWRVPAAIEYELARDPSRIDADGRFEPPTFDAAGYLAAVDSCKQRFPGLRVLSGVELGEPHRVPAAVRELVAGGSFERVLGSLHCLELDGDLWLADDLMAGNGPPEVDRDDVVRAYLREAASMVAAFPDEIQVLAHIDYPLRRWGGPVEATRYQAEFRDVLDALAVSGRALEVNTRVPLPSEVVGWWRDAGGEAVSFGSDAHRPGAVANGFRAAAAMVESFGFRPDRHPHGFWHA